MTDFSADASGDGNLTVAYYAVAFVDILGQRDELARIPKTPNLADPAVRDTLVQHVRLTYGVVLTFYESFDSFLGSLTLPGRLPLPAEIDKLVHQSHIRKQTFSDGLVMYASLQETPGRVPVQDLFGLLGACATTFILFLSQGRPIRGGLDVGIGMDTKEHGIYGPVVASAYDLESKKAELPRIAVGPTVSEYIRAEQNLLGPDLMTEYRRRLARICGQLLVEDADGTTILDHLGPGFQDHVAHDLLRDVPIQAYKFVTEELDRRTKAGDRKLQERYDRLKVYFDRNIDRWIRS